MVFDLGSGRKIALCGSREKHKKDTVYDGFILFEYGRKDIIEEWEETSACKVEQDSDTVVVTEMEWLPVGRNFEAVSVPFRTTDIFLRGSKVIDTSFNRADLPKYSTVQINKILHQYTTLTGKDLDSVNLIAHRLFWAYASGSSRAEKYLRGIKSKFGPFDGAIAEEWDGTWAEYGLWKKEHSL